MEETWIKLAEWAGAQAVSAVIAAASARDITFERPYYARNGPRSAWDRARVECVLEDDGFELNKVYDLAKACRVEIERARVEHPEQRGN